MGDLEADQLPDLQPLRLRTAVVQVALALCSGWVLVGPLVGVWRLLRTVLATYDLVTALLIVPALYVLYGVQLLLAIVILKWLVLGKVTEGTYRFGSFYHLRWWIIDRLVAWANLLFLDNLRGSPLLNIFFCLLGCRIHLSAYLDTAFITGFDLVEVGANSIVLSGACIHGHSLEDGQLVLAKVSIAEEVYIGPKCLIMPGSDIKAGAVVRPMTSVRSTTVEGVVEGSPMRAAAQSSANYGKLNRGPLSIFMMIFFQLFGLCFAPGLSVIASYGGFRALIGVSENIGLLPSSLPIPALQAYVNDAFDVGCLALSILAVTGPYPFHVIFLLIVEESQPSMAFLEELITYSFDQYAIFGAIWVVIIYYMVYSFALMIMAVTAKWVLFTIGPKPTSLSIDGPISFTLLFRRWLKERLMVWVWYRALLIFLGSEVVSMWMRVNGGRVGLRTVFAKIDPITDPDALRVGADCHFGDGCMSLPVFIQPGGTISHAGFDMEDGSLVGMHGLLLPGCDMGEECILGALSLANEDQKLQKRSIYFGTPSTRLNLGGAGGSEELEVHRDHPLRFYLYMALYPFVIFSVVILDLALGGYIAAVVIVKMRISVGEWLPWALTPAIFGVFGFSLVVLGIFNKWFFVYRFREFNTPAFSSLFYRRSLGMGLSWFLGDTFILLFAGTPVMSLWLRLLGADVHGWRVYIETTFFTEPDLISLGSFCVVERNVLPFCHVMESGWLSAKKVTIGREARIGSHSVLLPGVKLSEGTVLGSFSCAAKAEMLPPFTLCLGCPVSDISSRLGGRGGGYDDDDDEDDEDEVVEEEKKDSSDGGSSSGGE